jgi:hypothetical protein
MHEITKKIINEPILKIKMSSFCKEISFRNLYNSLFISIYYIIHFYIESLYKLIINHIGSVDEKKKKN